jgi:hypothetical protein
VGEAEQDVDDDGNVELGDALVQLWFYFLQQNGRGRRCASILASR